MATARPTELTAGTVVEFGVSCWSLLEEEVGTGLKDLILDRLWRFTMEACSGYGQVHVACVSSYMENQNYRMFSIFFGGENVAELAHRFVRECTPFMHSAVKKETGVDILCYTCTKSNHFSSASY